MRRYPNDTDETLAERRQWIEDFERRNADLYANPMLREALLEQGQAMGDFDAAAVEVRKRAQLAEFHDNGLPIAQARVVVEGDRATVLELRETGGGKKRWRHVETYRGPLGEQRGRARAGLLEAQVAALHALVQVDRAAARLVLALAAEDQPEVAEAIGQLKRSRLASERAARQLDLAGAEHEHRTTELEQLAAEPPS